MKTKFNGILTLILAFIVQISFAQDRTISGTVSDESGPLPGVTIFKKGTTQGTETDFDGNYSIQAKNGDVLVFSFVGMKNAERTVGASNQINVTLENDNLLEEVVVVGYGTTTKKAYTGTAKVVKTADIQAKSFTNVSQSLAGEAAGVNVINTTGQPGSTSTIRIRGFGSVNGNRSPLYVLDGVPFSGNLNSINPEDIASTTILKDATATAIYGSRGANGVILITTKGGKKNSSSIEVDVKTGVNFSFIPRYDVIRSSNDFIGLAWEAIYNQGNNRGVDPVAFANANLFGSIGINPDYNSWDTSDVSQLIDPATRSVRSGVGRRYLPEYWGDYSFQPSIRSEANVKMSGGGENGKYFTSIGYLDSKGYSVNSDYTRYSGRINLTQDVREWLTSNFNIGYAYSELNNNGQTSDSGNVFFLVDNMPSIYPVFERDANGNRIPDPVFGGFIYDIGRGRNFSGLTNGLADARNNIRREKRHEVNANVSFDVDLFENLKFKTQFGLQHNDRTRNIYSNPFFGVGVATEGSLSRRIIRSTTMNFLNMFTYTKEFGEHSITALAAHETNQNEFKLTNAAKNKVVLPGLLEFNNFIVTLPTTSYTNKSRLESYFAQANYSFKDTYYLSGSIRRDGSSRFLGSNKWDTFGSVGGAWIMTNENFLNNNKYLKFLKLKASYGIIGEQSGAGLFPGLTLHDINNASGEISYTESFVGNSALTWETSKMYQVGVESKISDFLDVNVDYYIKDTENLLFDKRLPISTGVAIVDVNEGVLRNSGLEFDINARIINKEDFKFSASINGEFLNNEIKEMPIDGTGQPKVIDIDGIFGRTAGRSLYDIYTREWAGVDPSNGAPLWYTYFYDANGDGVFNESQDDEVVNSLHEYQAEFPNRQLVRTTTSNSAVATRQFLNKSSIPTVRGGFRLNMTYKNFDISSQFVYSLGGYAYDAAYADMMDNDRVGSWNWHKNIFNRWQQPGDITNVPALTNGENDTSNPDRNITYNTANAASSRFVTKTDYLALNNVRIGYTVPSKYLEKSGISNLNIWMSGDNLFLLSAREGFNPTTSESGGSARYSYAPLTNISLGVRVKF
ncbi:SusC/RagA family TonB-dependent receptor precursor [Tenacibaculum sp. 190130A14a]|uniref:TonB-dependent starch-binding outer membrane protein SusC n=1 Tax=Tenacibaculum polynesiense TaxID=3137857 RepID=A0ABP1F0U2_9FLAO